MLPLPWEGLRLSHPDARFACRGGTRRGSCAGPAWDLNTGCRPWTNPLDRLRWRGPALSRHRSDSHGSGCVAGKSGCDLLAYAAGTTHVRLRRQVPLDDPEFRAANGMRQKWRYPPTADTTSARLKCIAEAVGFLMRVIRRRYGAVSGARLRHLMAQRWSGASKTSSAARHDDWPASEKEQHVGCAPIGLASNEVAERGQRRRGAAQLMQDPPSRDG